MPKPNTTQEKQIHLSQKQADRLSHLAEVRQMSEDQIVEKALEIMFSLGDLIEEDIFWEQVDKGDIQPYTSQARLATSQLKEHQAQYRFKQDLLEQGLLDKVRDVNITSPTDDVSPEPVEGKPLSEIIIEERR